MTGPVPAAPAGEMEAEMERATAAASPGIWRRGAHEVSLARLYLLRAVGLFVAIDGCFSKLPAIIHPNLASRGIIPALLEALWVSAIFVVRYPLRMMPIFLFELIWKTLWLVDYGAPQWLGGMRSPALSRDLFEIGFFPLPIALVIPWGYVWRHYVRQPADRWRQPPRDASAGGVSPLRLELVRAAFLVSAIAGCVLVLPGILRPDPALRGMQESMTAGLWVCAFLGLRHPLQMLPILLFELVAATFWLIDYGLPLGLSGAPVAQVQADLPPIAATAVVLALAMPWPYVWRRFIREKSERWR